MNSSSLLLFDEKIRLSGTACSHLPNYRSPASRVRFAFGSFGRKLQICGGAPQLTWLEFHQQLSTGKPSSYTNCAIRVPQWSQTAHSLDSMCADSYRLSKSRLGTTSSL